MITAIAYNSASEPSAYDKAIEFIEGSVLFLHKEPWIVPADGKHFYYTTYTTDEHLCSLIEMIEKDYRYGTIVFYAYSADEPIDEHIEHYPSRLKSILSKLAAITDNLIVLALGYTDEPENVIYVKQHSSYMDKL